MLARQPVERRPLERKSLALVRWHPEQRALADAQRPQQVAVFADSDLDIGVADLPLGNPECHVMRHICSLPNAVRHRAHIIISHDDISVRTALTFTQTAKPAAMAPTH